MALKQGLSLTIDEKGLKEIMKRLKAAPKKIQTGAGKAGVRAGAAVIRAAVMNESPPCIVPSIRVVARTAGDTRKDRVKFSVSAGSVSRGLTASDMELVAGKHDVSVGKIQECLPAIWYELGTYANRDIGEDPYAPATLRKKSYASGRSNSPFWNVPSQWIGAVGFMRRGSEVAFRSGAVEQAIVTKVDDYLKKKGV